MTNVPNVANETGVTSEAPLLVESRGGVRLLRLNRPQRRNALDRALLEALDVARERAEAEGVRAVVLTGAEPQGAFCAGLDLNDLRHEGSGQFRADLPLVELFHATLARLEGAPFALLTAVNGPAVGGGCELALVGDVRLAHPKATFAIPAGRLGVTYPTPGLARLREALGSSLLRAMLATGLPLSAQRLERAGALWALAEDPASAALELAASLEAWPGSPSAHRHALLDLRPGRALAGKSQASPSEGLAFRTRNEVGEALMERRRCSVLGVVLLGALGLSA
ncbi:MAG: enoyl-CoA hydratase/isomerase family protein, partial [Polyangiaceae bacterium]|nr:enoyl-CoA hydratase/isomerase family protein [Polyangiaceae bacterium]